MTNGRLQWGLGVGWVVGAGALAMACGADGGAEEYPFETGALMKPGDNCRSCHGATSSSYPEAPDWSVAGTVYEGPDSEQGAAGVVVTIEDAAGKEVQLQTNGVGNFYTDESFAPPLRVALERDGVVVSMPVPPPSGGCNACHSQPTIGGAPGRLFVPRDGVYESAGTCADDVTASFPAGGVDQEYSCEPYRCEADASGARCSTSCAGDSDCAEGATCALGRCVSR